jgi:hypothetical protein
MATSEPRLTVKQSLTPSELDDVGALVREARWNQLAADWRIFIEFGRLYAIHGDAGRVIATTATLPYGGRFAWISMVLVAGEYRRHGVVAAGDGGPDGRQARARARRHARRPRRLSQARLRRLMGLPAADPP